MISTNMTFELLSEHVARLTVDDKLYVGTPAQCFKDFISDLNGATKDATPGTLRRRYTIIDHEDANAMEVGTSYVLSPAKNPADLAAMHTLIANVEPKLAGELQALVDMIEAHPDRRLGSYGEKCLPHVTHEKVQDFKTYRLGKDAANG